MFRNLYIPDEFRIMGTILLLFVIVGGGFFGFTVAYEYASPEPLVKIESFVSDDSRTGYLRINDHIIEIGFNTSIIDLKGTQVFFRDGKSLKVKFTSEEEAKKAFELISNEIQCFAVGCGGE